MGDVYLCTRNIDDHVGIHSPCDRAGDLLAGFTSFQEYRTAARAPIYICVIKCNISKRQNRASILPSISGMRHTTQGVPASLYVVCFHQISVSAQIGPCKSTVVAVYCNILF